MQQSDTQRKPHRLSGWDYHHAGYYFVTICTKDHKPLLSSVRKDQPIETDSLSEASALLTELTPTGQLVKTVWERMPQCYDGVLIDCYCIMPNHFHWILILAQDPETPDAFHSKSLSELIRGFKSITTREYRAMCGKDRCLWQASFYDEIIRDDEMLFRVRNYIEGNPLKWLDDPYYCAADAAPER